MARTYEWLTPVYLNLNQILMVALWKFFMENTRLGN